MVGRLVEEQEVRLLQQEPAEGHATPLAAGKGLHLSVGGRAPKSVHGDLEVRSISQAFRCFDLLLDPRLLVRSFSISSGSIGSRTGTDLFEAAEGALTAGHTFLHVAKTLLDGPRPAPAAGTPVIPSVSRASPMILVDPGHDPEQARLAGPFRPITPILAP